MDQNEWNTQYEAMIETHAAHIERMARLEQRTATIFERGVLGLIAAAAIVGSVAAGFNERDALHGATLTPHQFIETNIIHARQADASGKADGFGIMGIGGITAFAVCKGFQIKWRRRDARVAANDSQARD